QSICFLVCSLSEDEGSLSGALFFAFIWQALSARLARE
ncbi:hypothetical protein A2U01_0017182, partial [Trifolium medium]|nr:hypothetical protein [Trifolium medium]